MKRLLLLGLVAISVASMGGCRWCGWGREGDVCNACQGPAGYPGDVYYGGEYYGGDYGTMVDGQVIDGQIMSQGMPTIPEHLPSPTGAR